MTSAAPKPHAKKAVFLLTGFLGSGKTTLLNAALRTPVLANTAVIVNELGDIGIDHLIISQASDNVVLLDGGCLCCANSGALHETLADLASRCASGTLPPFDRVIVETSGAADPAPLLNLLLRHPLITSQYELEATVCVVDSQHFLDSRANYRELDRQAAIAERIVMSKTDIADPAPTLDFLHTLNPAAEVFLESPATAAFFACTSKHNPSATSIGALGPTGKHSHASAIRAYSFRPPGPITWAGWSAWSSLVAREFGRRLVRVKGLLRMNDGGEIVFVHGVQGLFNAPLRVQGWPDANHDNRLVCIASDLDEHEISITLPALSTTAGTQARYSMQDMRRLSNAHNVTEGENGQ